MNPHATSDQIQCEGQQTLLTFTAYSSFSPFSETWVFYNNGEVQLTIRKVKYPLCMFKCKSGYQPQYGFQPFHRVQKSSYIQLYASHPTRRDLFVWLSIFNQHPDDSLIINFHCDCTSCATMQTELISILSWIMPLHFLPLNHNKTSIKLPS